MSARRVLAKHNHVMFVGEDDTIMGMGYRACGKEDNLHKMRIIEKPESCKDYKQVAVGKFFRLLLT